MMKIKNKCYGIWISNIPMKLKERMAEDIRLYVALTQSEISIIINFPRVFEKWNALLYVLTKGQLWCK